MTKRFFTVCFLLLLTVCLGAAAFTLETEALPSSVILTWNEVEDAVYYDIYNEDNFIVRLDSSKRLYTVKHLLSETRYDFSIAARTEDNATLAAAFADETTTTWDGVYLWENETDDDNDGKMRSLCFRVDTAIASGVGQYHNIYMVMDDGTEIKIFPLYGFSDPAAGSWVDYDDTGEAGTSYRLNAERFNTYPFNPQKWRLDKVVIDYDSSSAYIQTSALGFVFETTTECEFYIEDGAMKMSFSTEGSGIADAALFKNPNPGEGDAFILTRID